MRGSAWLSCQPLSALLISAKSPLCTLRFLLSILLFYLLSICYDPLSIPVYQFRSPARAGESSGGPLFVLDVVYPHLHLRLYVYIHVCFYFYLYIRIRGWRRDGY